MTDATQQIAYAILAYLAENPDAEDTLKGISEWWLSEQTGRPNMASVKKALDKLITGGWVVASEREGEGAQTYYKVNRRRLKEIEALLTQFKNSDAPND
jgi:DNA-binding PadR family transcriptional regulator